MVVTKRFGESSIQPLVPQNTFGKGSGDEKHSDGLPVEDDKSSNDNEYLPCDELSVEEDEETIQILQKFKQFKSKLKAGEAGNIDDVVLERPKEVPQI